MRNLNDVTGESVKDHNPKWQQILNHLYRKIILGGSGSGKTNALRSLIHHQEKYNNDIIDKFFSMLRTHTNQNINC